MSTRKKIADDVMTEVLTRSRRRCCICYGLNRDGETKQGQLAHLDKDNSNNQPDNLAFLCLAHHDQYDSRTSQSKGFTIDEAKAYRSELYSHVQSLVLKNLMVKATPEYSALEEEEALSFYTGTLRSQSAIQLLANEPMLLKDINAEIPPFDLKWTSTILNEVTQAGWVRRVPGEYLKYELSMNGRRMLEVLSLLPGDLKERAWNAVWLPEARG